MSDGFLARWSRRKRDEARRPADIPTVAPETAMPAGAPAEDEASLSPEELAQLPSLDALTAATDLTPFLRTGVPRVLRNAALRRMWSVDPAIRDFVSEAREYAYDWNTPGGVPGTGGAISAEDVRAMVEKVFGGVEETPPCADSDEAGISENGAPLPSPRGRGEGFTPLAGGEASREPQVRREGEGVPPDETPPARPPHPRSGSACAPFAPGEGGESLSPPAGRGEFPRLSLSTNSPAPAESSNVRSRQAMANPMEEAPRPASDRSEPPPHPACDAMAGPCRFEALESRIALDRIPAMVPATGRCILQTKERLEGRQARCRSRS